jgi:hypothetical protein
MNYIGICKEVILSPSDFFRRMPTSGGYSEPVTFAAVSLIIGSLLRVFIGYGMFTFGIHSSLLTFGTEVSALNFSTFSEMFGLFFMSIIAIFLGSLVLNFLYTAFGGTGTYEGTVRFMSYGYAINIISWIPLVGLIAIIYALYLSILGGSFVHNVSVGRSALIVILLYPAMILVFIIIIGFVVALSSLIF